MQIVALLCRFPQDDLIALHLAQRDILARHHVQQHTAGRRTQPLSVKLHGRDGRGRTSQQLAVVQYMSSQSVFIHSTVAKSIVFIKSR